MTACGDVCRELYSRRWFIASLVVAYREAVFLLCHSALAELAVAPAAPDEDLSVRRDGRGVGIAARDAHDGPPQKAADEGRLVRVAPGITGIL